MNNPWKKRVLAFNRARAADREAAQDLMALLCALPPGIKRQLLGDAACAPILSKYAIKEDEQT